MQENDLNLVKLARNGDRDAFRELMERHQRRIFGLCYGMVRNRDDAMDLTQDTFLKIFRSLEGFGGQSSFYTWAYRIATNVCIDFLRKSSRTRTVDYDDGIGRDEQSATTDAFLPSRLGVNPSKAYGRKELLTEIEAALGKLSDAHREAIVLREVQGLSYQEMSDVIGVSIGTVMSRLHHARKNMQKHLRDYVGDELGGGSAAPSGSDSSAGDG